MKNLILFIAFIKGIYCLKSIVWINKQSQLLTIYELESFGQILRNLSKSSSETNSIMATDCYEIEHHNFHNQPIRLLFHEEAGVITSFANTRITGYLGEIWTFLSEYANFRCILLNAPEKRIGLKLTKHSSYNGLLRYIDLNEADIIASIQMFPEWNDIIDFCLPLYKDRVRIFTKVIYEENSFWVMHLVSWKVYIVAAILQILFSVTCMINTRFTTQRTKKNEEIPINMNDIIFYYFSLSLQRSYYIFNLNKRARFVNILACVQSVLVLSYNSAGLLSIMMQKTEYEPYQNLKNLSDHTEFTVLVEKDSLVHLTYEYLQSYQNYSHDLRYLMANKRIKFIPSRERMYHLACASKIPYAIMESEYFKANVIEYGCNMKAYGRSYFETFVTGGVKKNFKYKRTLDLGFLKMFEMGILTAQKNRLLGLPKDYDNRNKFYQPINLIKIKGMILIYFIGVFSSVIILLLENIIIYYRKKKA